MGERIVHAGIVVGIAHLLFKFAGLLQAKALAQFVDKGIFETVYVVAFENVVFAMFLIGEEIIGPAFLPVFMREFDTRDEAAAWRFANCFLTLQTLVLALALALVMLLPGAMIQLVTAWSATHSPERFISARQSLVWLAPSLFCLSLGSTTYMILNGYKKFFLAAFGDASWKFCIVLCVAVGMGLLGYDHRALVLGILLGSVAKLVTHLCGLAGKLSRFRPSLALRNPALRSALLLMLPLVCGIVFAKVRDIFNNVTVLSHLETEGLMQANFLGRKLFQPISWLVPYAFSIAMFPFFCELVDRNDHARLGRVLTQASRMVLSVFIPLTLVCVVMAEPITDLLFRGGKFGGESVHWTAISMACYTLVLPATAVEYFLMQAFFAQRRMVAITVVGILFSALSMLISYVGIVMYGARGVAALAIVAGGFTLSRTLKATTLAFMLRRFVPGAPLAETFSFLLRAALAGIVAALCCLLVRHGFTLWHVPGPERLVLLVELAACGGAALAAFFVCLFLLKIEEPRQMWAWTVTRIRERKRSK